jgi:hypothetical protein
MLWERYIPWRNAQYNTIWLLDDQRARALLFTAGNVSHDCTQPACNVSQHIRHLGHIEPVAKVVRGARLNLHVVCKLVCARLNHIRRLQEDVALRRVLHLGPCRKCGFGCRYSALDIVQRGRRSAPYLLVRCRRRDGKSGCSGDLLAVDEQRHGIGRVWLDDLDTRHVSFLLTDKMLSLFCVDLL